MSSIAHWLQAGTVYDKHFLAGERSFIHKLNLYISAMKNSFVKVFVIVIAVLGLMLAGLLYFLNYELDDFVRGKLDEQLDPSWKVSFQDLSASLFSMSFEVEGLNVSRSDGTGLYWKASVDKSSVDGLHPLQILFSNELIAEAVKLHDLEVEIHRFRKSKKSKKKKKKKKKNKSGSMTLIVEKIMLDDGRVFLENDSIGYLDSRIHFETERIEFDSLAKTPLELAEKISLRLSDLSYFDPDSTQVIEIKEFTKERGKSLKIDSLSLSPLLNLKEYSSYHGWRKGRNTIQVEGIIVQMPELRSDSVYGFPKVTVVRPKVQIDKDMTYGLPERRTKLPQEALLALKFPFVLDSLLVENGQLEFKLQQEEGLVAEITLAEVTANAGVQNVRRDSLAFHFSGEALALNGSSLNVQSEYRYGDGNPWNLSGSLSDTDLEFLSDFLRKMAGVEVSSGKLNKLNFEMEGNNQVSSGQVTFLYDNLGITAVDKETGRKKVVLNALADVLGALVFWKQNPNDGNMRVGDFSLERDVRKAFPSQWIDGLLAGIIESVAKINPTKIREKQK